MTELPDGWLELDVPEGFDTRTFVSEETYGDLEISRAYVSYYNDRHCIEASVEGDTEFHYHDTEADAIDTAHEEMKRINGEIDTDKDVRFFATGESDE